jgi:uncharacterized protein (DUF58 family)
MHGGAEYGALLDALRGVRWHARRRVPGALVGAHRSRMRGTAPEFSEYRAYRQGDDPRRIDWKLLGRTDRAAIRLADDHAILPTGIAVDASPSMAFPEPGLDKWRLARRIAVGLAAVARAAGDPVALAIPGPAGARVLPPRTRAGVLGEIARALDDARPSGGSIADAVRALRGCARLVVVADFLGEEDELLRMAREHIAAGGDVHAVHVVAREELDPAHRAILATDPERPELHRALADATRDAYLSAFGAWRDALGRAWRVAGGTMTLARTDEPAEHVVRRIVGGAERGR